MMHVTRYGDDAPKGAVPGTVKSMTFTCDYDGCKAAPTDKEVVEAGGLRAMGWYAAGGKHYCPKHWGD